MATFLLVSGGDYTALTFERHCDPQEVYVDMVAKDEEKRVYEAGELEGVEVEIMQYGDVDEKFVDMIRWNLSDSDILKGVNIYRVESVKTQEDALKSQIEHLDGKLEECEKDIKSLVDTIGRKTWPRDVENYIPKCPKCSSKEHVSPTQDKYHLYKYKCWKCDHCFGKSDRAMARGQFDMKLFERDPNINSFELTTEMKRHECPNSSIVAVCKNKKQLRHNYFVDEVKSCGYKEQHFSTQDFLTIIGKIAGNKVRYKLIDVEFSHELNDYHKEQISTAIFLKSKSQIVKALKWILDDSGEAIQRIAWFEHRNNDVTRFKLYETGLLHVNGYWEAISCLDELL